MASTLAVVCGHDYTRIFPVSTLMHPDYCDLPRELPESWFLAFVLVPQFAYFVEMFCDHATC